MVNTKYIDHTLLKATAKKEDILKLCDEAYKYQFKSVCINPYYIPLAKQLLDGTDILICTVIGFPLGANALEVKVFETIKAIADGADEVDMVINIGAALEHNYDYVYEEVKAVVDAAKGVLVKVILETCYLSDEEIIEVSKQCIKAGADFVKTSTGFGSAGATTHAVKLMKETVQDKLEVKASGGIRDYDTFLKMVEAGATRIGTSNGISILEGEKI